MTHTFTLPPQQQFVIIHRNAAQMQVCDIRWAPPRLHYFEMCGRNYSKNQSDEEPKVESNDLSYTPGAEFTALFSPVSPSLL